MPPPAESALAGDSAGQYDTKGGIRVEPTLRIGVIGCGEIAQIMHLPYLKELPELEVAAICDVSEALLAAVGEQFGVAKRYLDYRALLADENLDAVAILTPDHADIAIAAAEAGKHIMVEKPLCFNLQEAERIRTAVRRNRVKLMVAYMKRYDPGYQWALPLLRDLRDVRLIRVHDLGGSFAINREIYSLRTATDISPQLIEASQERIRAAMLQAIGEERAALLPTYENLLLSCTHDAIVLRQAFGGPRQILCADAFGVDCLVALLEYSPQTRCVWEVGLLKAGQWWDESLTAYAVDRTVEISFPFPYLRNAPTTVTITQMEDGAVTRREVLASYDEAFKREWRHFYTCVTEDREPITNVDEGVADIALLIDLIKAVRL